MKTHLVLIVRHGYIGFRTSDSRSGGEPHNGTLGGVTEAMERIKQAVSIPGEEMTQEILWDIL